MSDTLTLTLRRGNWQISRTVPVSDLQTNSLDDIYEEMSFALSTSWQQLSPAAKKEFKRPAVAQSDPQAGQTVSDRP